MYRKLMLIAGITIVLFAASCKTPSKTTHASTAGDSLLAAKISTTYLGMLPCADCSAISYRLKLNPDFTYSEKLIFIGKPDSTIDQSGTYSFHNSEVVMLDKPTHGMQYFKINQSGLVMMDDKEKEIKGLLAERYQLRPVVQHNPFQTGDAAMNETKWNQGALFFAIGSEHEWNLDITKSNGILFKRESDSTLVFPNVSAARANDADIVRYRTSNKNMELIVTISAGMCKDKINGQSYHYTVQVTLNPTVDDTTFTFNGCGSYTFDPALKSAWKLQAIDSIAFDSAGLPKGTPEITIDAASSRISGHTGCNRITGTCAVLGPDEIHFSMMASTKMACEGMEQESKFETAISDKLFRYVITGNTLELTSRKGQKLLFKK
ncbi:MAG TPA: copper resistance protein NlpE N-terminal domain-containing protein [Bacteroidia bacterium]|nr:copper resistance protein NlpE N-terminal domain-containing protein [Bacteroidia bacterium]